MKQPMKTTLAAVLAVSAAWFAISAVAAPPKSSAQEAAELDGNAFLDTGNDTPAIAAAPASKALSNSVASAPPAAQPAKVSDEPHHKSVSPKRVGELMTKADEKRRAEHPEKRLAVASVPVSAAVPALAPAASAATAATSASQSGAQTQGPSTAFGALPASAPTPKPPSEAAVINPMTGESLGTEELKGELTTATLRAEIAAQNFKAAQAQAQMSQLRFIGAPAPGGPLPPSDVTLAEVPKTVKVEPKETPKHVEVKLAKAAPIAVPAVLPTSPVTGIMSEGTVRYAVLQLDGTGEMASVGQTVHGRHVDAVQADGVVLDGHFYPIVAPVTSIASVDEQRAAVAPGGHSPVVYGSVSTERVATPNPFASGNNGGLPPLNAILARGQ